MCQLTVLAYILDEKEEDDRPGVTKPAINKDIVFDNVNFKYEEGAAVLRMSALLFRQERHLLFLEIQEAERVHLYIY